MRKLCAAALLLCLLPAAARAGEACRIHRIRIIANPYPEAIPGSEVLEVKFAVVRTGLVRELGWSAWFYDREKRLLASDPVLFLPRSRNPVRRLSGHRAKGPSEFVGFFPLAPGQAYAVVALGGPDGFAAARLPSSALIEEFRLERNAILPELARSSYRIIE